MNRKKIHILSLPQLWIFLIDSISYFRCWVLLFIYLNCLFVCSNISLMDYNFYFLFKDLYHIYKSHFKVCVLCFRYAVILRAYCCRVSGPKGDILTLLLFIVFWCWCLDIWVTIILSADTLNCLCWVLGKKCFYGFGT